ncbi:hypothetical protein Desaci_1388 [Desulfosporosinus acidiphilus SJ4]|uniref:SurA-like protein n=1 Tax=Desulfosporosinus acidiphilus (strain DSM 22704 / JCM 16185 / SJ4) TaxID=646529 RepID=I4D3N7_DESAJ|nr:SurA N-terminal domain-containing protein [Desulfosporosinus acidiphilus]AFM40411.1 hypothetical protein Desaci_1388 [Desulfosporosinus acidiphilus SJ4]
MFRRKIIFLGILSLSLFLFGCNQKKVEEAQVNQTQVQIPVQKGDHFQVVQGTVGNTSSPNMADINNLRNTKFPEIVAEVGDYKITGLQLTKEIALKRNDYINNIKKPQSEAFYEKVALGLLVKNALIDNEVKKQGLTVTVEEAKAYLEQQEKSMTSLPDSDPAKEAYLKDIKINGFDNVSEYINSQNVINMTQTILGRAKLKNAVLQSISQDQNEASKAWDDYTEKLLDQGNFKILLPIDIKGYQQLEAQVALNR